MCKVVMIGSETDNMPIKQSGEILTKDEFVELISDITKFYETMTDEEIKQCNYEIMYQTYRSLGETHEEVVARIGAK